MKQCQRNEQWTTCPNLGAASGGEKVSEAAKLTLQSPCLWEKKPKQPTQNTPDSTKKACQKKKRKREKQWQSPLSC